MEYLYRASVAHLESVHESYWRHGYEALKIACKLAVAFGAVLVHAVVPGVCTHTASDIAADIVRTRALRENKPA